MLKPSNNLSIILYGAGGAGRYALSYLRSIGIEPALFADNDLAKQGTTIEGVEVQSPAACQIIWPKATWVACSIHHQFAVELRADLAALGVATLPLWECLPVCHGLPSDNAMMTVDALIDDQASVDEWANQFNFRARAAHSYDSQIEPSDIRELYFPDFIRRRSDETFIDCGAADGDTIAAFCDRYADFNMIVAFEPDHINYLKLKHELVRRNFSNILVHRAAVTDFDGHVAFKANGDCSSHISTEDGVVVRAVKLDQILGDVIPTFIKMDIEGAELSALWGARNLIQQHSPVLAVCAYHTSDHLWQIPLLIHAINPDYKLFFRRYAEGAFELVWYAVPADRVVTP